MNTLLILPENYGGVEYHRLFIPFKNIPSTLVCREPEKLTVSELKDKNVSVVWYSRNISPIINAPWPIIDKIRKAGCKIVVDMDDYWELDYGHVLKNYWSSAGLKKCYTDQMIHADYVCTTHNHLASLMMKELKIKSNKIIVASNAIDQEEPQYNQDFNYTHENIFWQGSVTHHYDLKQICQPMNELGLTLNMAGYNAHSNTEWEATESLFQSVNRINNKPVTEYMDSYVNMGISVIPLERKKFNHCKSNLKMLEAGWAQKPVIVSGIHPYTAIAKDGKNCLTAYSHNAWVDALTKLTTDKSFADDLRFTLHDLVKSEYDIKKVNKIRINLLNQIA
jgi:glycosyltransferase involved in cell wall biosynthesis